MIFILAWEWKFLGIQTLLIRSSLKLPGSEKFTVEMARASTCIDKRFWMSVQAAYLWLVVKSRKCDIYEFLFGWNNLLWDWFGDYLASTVHWKVKKWYCTSFEANLIWFILLWSSRDLPLPRTCSKWLVHINYADFQQFYARLGFQIISYRSDFALQNTCTGGL